MGSSAANRRTVHDQRSGSPTMETQPSPGDIPSSSFAKAWAEAADLLIALELLQLLLHEELLQRIHAGIELLDVKRLVLHGHP